MHNACMRSRLTLVKSVEGNPMALERVEHVRDCRTQQVRGSHVDTTSAPVPMIVLLCLYCARVVASFSTASRNSSTVSRAASSSGSERSPLKPLLAAHTASTLNEQKARAVSTSHHMGGSEQQVRRPPVQLLHLVQVAGASFGTERSKAILPPFPSNAARNARGTTARRCVSGTTWYVGGGR